MNSYLKKYAEIGHIFCMWAVSSCNKLYTVVIICSSCRTTCRHCNHVSWDLCLLLKCEAISLKTLSEVFPYKGQIRFTLCWTEIVDCSTFWPSWKVSSNERTFFMSLCNAKPRESFKILQQWAVLSKVIIESTLINMHLTLTVNPTNFKYIK